MDNEKYTWVQEFNEVEMVFELGNAFDKTAVVFKATKDALKIQYGDRVLADGLLFAPIKADETYWYMSGGALKFVLTKNKGAWWECVIKGHTKVDVSKIAENKTISDLNTLDPEERRIVEEMMLNQNSKSQHDDLGGYNKDEVLQKLMEDNKDHDEK